MVAINNNTKRRQRTAPKGKPKPKVVKTTKQTKVGRYRATKVGPSKKQVKATTFVPNVGGNTRRGTRARRDRPNQRKVKRFEAPSGCIEPLYAPHPRYQSSLSIAQLHTFLNTIVHILIGRSGWEDYYKRTVNDAKSETTLKAWLWSMVYNYAYEVGALRYTEASVDQSVIQFAPPSDSVAVPVAVAKLMQCLAPYRDPHTGVETQMVFSANSTYTFDGSSFQSAVADTSMNYTTSDFGWTKSAVYAAGTETAWRVATSGTFTWANVKINEPVYDDLVRGSGLGFVEYGKIPRRGFDGTGACMVVSGAQAGSYVACPVQKFDPEFAVLLFSASTSLASAEFYYAYQKPLPVLTLPHQVVNTSPWLKYQFAALAVLADCRFHPGPMKKVLATHPVSGGKGGTRLRSMFPIIRDIDWQPIARLCHCVAVQLLTDKMDDAAFTSALNNGAGVTAPATDPLCDLYYAIMTYFQSVVFNRVCYTSTSINLLQPDGTVPFAHLFLNGNKWLGVAAPIVVLDLVRELGVTVLGGRAVLPMLLLGNMTSGLLNSEAEFGEMSVQRDFGSNGNKHHACVFPAQRTVATTSDYLVNGKALNRTTLGYDAATTFPSMIPNQFAPFFIKQLTAFKLTSQFLDEQIPLMGGNIMVMSVDESSTNGDIGTDLIFGLGAGATSYLTVSTYKTYETVESSVPMSREDVGRAICLCPFMGVSGNSPILRGAGKLNIDFDPFDAVTVLVETALSSDESVFAKEVAFMAADKGNMMHAYRTALGPIYGNLVPEDPFVSDGCDLNWRKAVYNMLTISASPYHKINAQDFSQFNSPSFYEKVFKGLKKLPKNFHEGYRKVVDFAGKELPADIGSVLGGWSQLINEQNKNAQGLMGAAKMLSVALA